MRIRKATGADAEVLAALRYAFRAALDPPTESEPAFVARTTRWMRDRLESSVWHCWIAEEENSVVGQVWVEPIEKIPNPVGEPEIMAYVTNVYVKSSARGRGIGSSLLAKALEWCKESGVDGALLRPTDRSRPLYERHGFRTATGLMEVRYGSPARERDGTPDEA